MKIKAGIIGITLAICNVGSANSFAASLRFATPASSSPAVSVAAALKATMSAENCFPLAEWEQRAAKSDYQTLATSLLPAYGLETSAINARRLMSFIYVCYMVLGQNSERFGFSALEGAVGTYAEQTSRDEGSSNELDERWRQDLRSFAEIVRTTPINDPRLPFVFTAASSLLSRWNVMPHSITGSSEYNALGAAISDKRNEIAGQQLAQAEEEKSANLEARIDAGLTNHGDQIDQLGLSDSFLDSYIVLEDGSNRRWITMRSWLAALYESRAYDLIEVRQILGTDVQGIVTKRKTERPISWFFTSEAGELFLTYTGELDQIIRISDRAKIRYALTLQSMVSLR